MATTTLPEKLPEESVFVTMNFGVLFDTGVTVQSAEVTVQRYSGAVDGSDLATLPATVQDGWVSQKVSGGLPDVVYLVKALATGSDGTVLGVELLLPVVAVRLG